jgi:uncharacterized protein (UPF0264 family)
MTIAEPRSSLLVSVRSAAEAEVALVGGAHLIDVKEPRNGSLGRADESVIREVIRQVTGRRPVSAALGELCESPQEPGSPGLAYAKWGLSGCGGRNDWRRQLAEAGLRLKRKYPGCRPVAVAYVDWRRAEAPGVEEVCEFALHNRWGAVLFDTWAKDGTTLLDWLPFTEIVQWCNRCRAANVQVALAGSLGLEQIQTLHSAAPDWFAVRGAVCQGRRRESEIDATAVRRLIEALVPVR